MYIVGFKEIGSSLSSSVRAIPIAKILRSKMHHSLYFSYTIRWMHSGNIREISNILNWNPLWYLLNRIYISGWSHGDGPWLTVFYARLIWLKLFHKFTSNNVGCRSYMEVVVLCRKNACMVRPSKVLKFWDMDSHVVHASTSFFSIRLHCFPATFVIDSFSIVNSLSWVLFWLSPDSHDRFVFEEFCAADDVVPITITI